MGCLLEFVFEIVFEGIIELIGYCYLKLMQLIIPDQAVSENAKKAIRKAVRVFAALLATTLIIGLILFVQDDLYVKNVGKYMTFIPLTIIALQIGLGVIGKIISRLKK